MRQFTLRKHNTEAIFDHKETYVKIRYFEIFFIFINYRPFKLTKASRSLCQFPAKFI